MNRFDFATSRQRIHIALASISGVFFVASFLACGTQSDTQNQAGDIKTPQRNFLLIAVDTLRADHLGTYGYERNTSPQIDKFFQSAVVFDDAHSTSAWTLPSFASLMTSHHSSTHQCWQFTSRLSDSFTTLAEALSASGYYTGAVVSHEFLQSKYGLSQGFDYYNETLARYRLKSHKRTSSPKVTKAALAFLEKQANSESDRPWFFWAHYFDPHKTYKSHEGISEQFGTEELVDLYDGEIRFTDGYIGKLLESLENLGLADDTVVAFVADHGEEWGDHGRKEHGRTLYREVERVPFAIRVPGLPPRRVSAPVSGVDFMPTVLDLLGSDVPSEKMMGRSFAPLLRGEQWDSNGALLELRLNTRKVNTEAFVNERWKLIFEIPKEAKWSGEGPRRDGTKTMLFDRENDLTEQLDVALENPQVVERMTALLDDSLRAAREVAPLYEAAPEQELNKEDIERLRKLGYVDSE